MPLYERGDKELEGMFNTYKDSLSVVEEPVGQLMFHYIVKLLKICGDSKTGLST